MKSKLYKRIFFFTAIFLLVLLIFPLFLSEAANVEFYKDYWAYLFNALIGLISGIVASTFLALLIERIQNKKMVYDALFEYVNRAGTIQKIASTAYAIHSIHYLNVQVQSFIEWDVNKQVARLCQRAKNGQLISDKIKEIRQEIEIVESLCIKIQNNEVEIRNLHTAHSERMAHIISLFMSTKRKDINSVADELYQDFSNRKKIEEDSNKLYRSLITTSKSLSVKNIEYASCIDGVKIPYLLANFLGEYQ